MKLEKINIEEPEHITPEDINTFDKAKNHDGVRLQMTKGRGKHHGKDFYSGKYSGEKPIKIDGTIYKSADIETTETTQKADISGRVTSRYADLKSLADEFNKRIENKYAQITQNIWEELTERNLISNSMDLDKQLRRWLGIYAKIAWSDTRKKRSNIFIINSRFFNKLYGMFDNHFERDIKDDTESFRNYWKKVADYYSSK